MEARSPEALASLGLPPIDQVGLVVRSLDEAEARYGAFFGPFSRMDGSMQEVNYRGRIADVKLELMFGHTGELEIEFIEWQGGESPHREFLEAGREGLHHLRYRVEDTDAWIRKIEPTGYRAIWYKRLTPDVAFTYLERPGDPLLLELLQMPEGFAGPG